MMFEISQLSRIRRVANRGFTRASGNDHRRKALANAHSQSLSLYISTKSALWYMTGPHAHEYIALLRAQASQLYAATNALTESMRQCLSEMTDPIELANGMRVDDLNCVSPEKLLNRLRLENQIFSGALHTTFILGHEAGSVIDERYLEVLMHEARARARSLLEATRLA